MTVVELVIATTAAGVPDGAELTAYGPDGCPRSVQHLTPAPVAVLVVTAARAALVAWGLSLGEPTSDFCLPLPSGRARRVLLFDTDPLGDTETLTPTP
jgi:hypothetical protein